MKKRMLRSGLVGAMLATGSLVAMGSVASAATPSHGFLNAQKKLETQLSDRATQLGRLSADVAAAKSLTSAHAAVLTASISTATSNITALVAKVPTDKTSAQLNADRASMVQNNRVYAVLTPQVFQTIEADSIAVEVSADQGNEATLQTSVNALVGQPGYQNALNHYLAFIKRVNHASSVSSNVVTTVLAQTPADYPGDTHVFVTANHQLLSAGIDLAYANYDASIIGLASGGYNGS